MCCESGICMDSRCELVAGLINANPALTIDQAAVYASGMIEAEQREDYVRMYALLQEALWGSSNKNTA